MENKDWSTYLRMSKNGYNSSEDDEQDDDEDDLEMEANDEDSDDSSLTDDKTISAKAPSNKKSNNSSVKKSTHSLNSNSSLNKKLNLNKLKHANNTNIKPSHKASEIKPKANEASKTSDNVDIEIITKPKVNNSKPEEAIDRVVQHPHQRTYEYDDDVIDDEEDGDDDDEEDDDDDDDDDDDLDDDDIWTIKPKLYSYYEKQFKTMQPNINGFITGAVAKPFFERSKLPLNELSKIWELSDVTKDGALSFAEFCTAMHLVVLRVRHFDLPSELPAKLQPYAPLIDFNSDTNLNARNTNSGEASANKLNIDESAVSWSF